MLGGFIEERAVTIASYTIENNATVRQTAKQFGISKSMVDIVATSRTVLLVGKKRECFNSLYWNIPLITISYFQNLIHCICLKIFLQSAEHQVKYTYHA